VSGKKASAKSRFQPVALMATATKRLPGVVAGVLVAALAVYFVPRVWLPPAVTHSAFWVVLLLLGLLGGYGWVWLRDRMGERGGFVPSWAHALPILAGGVLLFLHADFDYKIAMDDYILASSAKSLHVDREYQVATHGYRHEGEFRLTAGYLDKRPPLYPVVVSLLHDLTGWRQANSFYANAFFTLILLGLVARSGFLLGGLFGEWMAVLLLVSIPLVAQNATGGGMDMANLCLLAGAILAAAGYLAQPSRRREGVFVLVVLLLSYSRYESVLYLLPAAVVVVAGWIRAERIFLSVPAIAAAPLLVPWFWQNRFFRSVSELWELPEGVAAPFGLHHFSENLGRAVYFFFNFDAGLANSAFVSVAGVLGILLFGLMLRRSHRIEMPLRMHQYSIAVFGAGILAVLCLTLAYHDGKLDRVFASRFALPFYLFGILAAVAVLGQLRLSRAWRAGLFGLVAVFLLGWTLPANQRELYTKRNYVHNELAWLTRDFGKTVGPNDLVIDYKSTAWTLAEKTALRPRLAYANLPWLRDRLEDGFYETIYLVERIEYRHGSDGPIPSPSHHPDGVLERTLLEARSFRPFSLMRLWRVEGINPGALPADFLESTAPGYRQEYDYDGL